MNTKLNYTLKNISNFLCGQSVLFAFWYLIESNIFASAFYIVFGLMLTYISTILVEE